MNPIPGIPGIPGINVSEKGIYKMFSHACMRFSTQTHTTSLYDPSKVRNVAIIAHVDHGKTTLMDKLLERCGSQLNMERAMDSNVHEQERGITIMSKYTRLYYKDYALHVVDTPGHADFGGEVERILHMVDGVILLCDASEGPMSQTKFVLSKALANKKPAIVVLNKVDREGHRAEEVENEIFDLFCNLIGDGDEGESMEHLLEYPLLFASAKQGWVVKELKQVQVGGVGGTDLTVEPLLDAIIANIPPPVVSVNVNEKEIDIDIDKILQEPFGMSINNIQTDNHLGRIVTGKVEYGTVRLGDRIKVLKSDNNNNNDDEKDNNNNNNNNNGKEGKVTKLFYLQGLNRVDVDIAYAGEIVSIAGCDGGVSDTVCALDRTEPIATIPISPPVISMTFGPNTSPLNGKEGTQLTSNMIKDRLYKELENNVTLQLQPAADSESINVQGRGELQIGILVETMRREGFELTVSPPAVMDRTDEDGKRIEPYEEVIVDVDPEYQGLVIDTMSNRKGNMIEFKDIGDRVRLVFHTPSRGLMGFRHEIMGATRGNATVNSMFLHYDRVNLQDFAGLKNGKLVSMEDGKTTGYALTAVEERGFLFVGVNEEVYEGMVIGQSARGDELDVNPCKAKKLTNIRSTGAEEKVNLSPPRKMTVEEIIAYMDEDEVLEVTPKSIRLRKKILESGARARYNKARKQHKN